MVISSEFDVRQYRDDNHQEDAAHFTLKTKPKLKIWILFHRISDRHKQKKRFLLDLWGRHGLSERWTLTDVIYS